MTATSASVFSGHSTLHTGPTGLRTYSSAFWTPGHGRPPISLATASALPNTDLMENAPYATNDNDPDDPAPFIQLAATVRNVLLYLQSKDQAEREPEHDKDRADRDEEAANQDHRGKVHVLRRW